MKYPKAKSTSKTGINFIRNVLESKNNIFNEIHQENDVGIDAIVEFVENEVPTGKCVALQIKSGDSYFSGLKKECVIPIGGHYTYWMNYSLPVLGIVYVPSLNCAFWIDIKQFFNENKDDKCLTDIRYPCTKLNMFDCESFDKYFIPYIKNSIPNISYDEACNLFNSENLDERYIGLITLFYKYSTIDEVWDIFIDYFKNHEPEEIPASLIVFLSHAPGHMDLYPNVEFIKSNARTYALNLLKSFKENEVIKLLTFIDEENFISRGSIGQCIEAIILSIPNVEKYLAIILANNTLSESIREGAAAIYGCIKKTDSLPVLYDVLESDKTLNLTRIPLMVKYIEEFGYLNYY